MGRAGRPKKQVLELTDDEREALERLTARPRSARTLAFRAKIILRCAEGGADTDVAADLRTHRMTVGKWRKRFIAQRLDGLDDEPRPGAERQIGDDEIEAVVTQTLESTPKGRTHWSTRSMAKSVGLNHSTIGRMRSAFNLIAPNRFDCRGTLCSSRKCATSSAST